jgi:hypothetical protein
LQNSHAARLPDLLALDVLFWRPMRPAADVCERVLDAIEGASFMSSRILTARVLVLVVGALVLTGSVAEAIEERANNCSRAEVAAAIARAGDGDTVIIPAGTCTWTEGITIEGKGIHLTAQMKGSVTLVHSAGGATLIAITRDRSNVGSISNLRFLQGASSSNGTHVSISGPGFPGTDYSPVLLHDNHFETNGAMLRAVLVRTVGGAIIYNNYFFSNLQDDQAIGFKAETAADGPSWTSASTWGTSDTTGLANTYVEDNVFDRFYNQALDPDGNARVVIRRNTFDRSAMASHGADTGPAGVRHVEVYENQFLFTNMGDCDGSQTPPLDYFLFIRGGSWVVADNQMPDLNSCAWGNKAELRLTVMNLRRNAGPYACWKGGYPAPRQVGRGHNGSAVISEPLYFWGNTGGANFTSPGLSDYAPDACSGGPAVSGYIQANRDFISGPKPGYTKYAYPHPMRGAPSVRPSNVRIVSE